MQEKNLIKSRLLPIYPFCSLKYLTIFIFVLVFVVFLFEIFLINRLKKEEKEIENREEQIESSPISSSSSSSSFYSSCLNNTHVKRLSKWLNLDKESSETTLIDWDPTRKAPLKI